MTNPPTTGPPPPPGPLKVGIFTQGRAVVCRITGDLHIETLPQAAHALDGAAAQHPWLLAVDLSQAQLCDAHSLGYLVALSRRVPLALIHPSPVVGRALQLAGMDRELRVFSTVEGAVRELERVERPR